MNDKRGRRQVNLIFWLNSFCFELMSLWIILSTFCVLYIKLSRRLTFRRSEDSRKNIEVSLTILFHHIHDIKNCRNNRHSWSSIDTARLCYNHLLYNNNWYHTSRMYSVMFHKCNSKFKWEKYSPPFHIRYVNIEQSMLSSISSRLFPHLQNLEIHNVSKSSQ